MRIGVDASCWANGRGYGRFAREVIRAMARIEPGNELFCVGDREALAAWPEPPANVRLVEVEQSVPPAAAAAARGRRTLGDILQMSRAASALPVDVFFFPAVYSFFPIWGRKPVVVTVHDSIAERFPKLALGSWRSRLFWWMKVRLALQQARLVVTVSEYAAREVMTVLGVARDRIRVAVEAPSEEYRPSSGAEVEVIARKYDLDGSRWFLYLGGFNPHKRVDTIIAAHAAVAAERPAAPLLVLAGDATRDPFYSEVPRLRSEIAARGTESLVRWVGYVPDADLRHLIAGAVALLLPSQAEGFGLPAIEAAACGTPVIATTASPLPELLDGGGIFHLPGDVPAIADAMASLLDDDAKRRAMGERALAMARRLSWEATAKAVLEALSSAVG